LSLTGRCLDAADGSLARIQDATGGKFGNDRMNFVQRTAPE
tara:strand:- start:615 stop:737 length:123 start_codon:yes stop_codon:yes gene_type:complete